MCYFELKAVMDKTSLIERNNRRLSFRADKFISTDGRPLVRIKTGRRIDQKERVAAPFDRRRYLVHHHRSRLCCASVDDDLSRAPPAIRAFIGRRTCSIDSRRSSCVMVMTVRHGERTHLLDDAGDFHQRVIGCRVAGWFQSRVDGWSASPGKHGY